MSRKFYLNQRFYAHIELGSSPFLKNIGPHDFANSFVKAQNVLIKNGTLGLSSHHGIHGNYSTNITLRNLVIKNFEIAGIAFNGANNVYVKNVEVGPVSD